jgi:hypothetical protein
VLEPDFVAYVELVPSVKKIVHAFVVSAEAVVEAQNIV